MIVTKHFVYIHTSRTAGTFLNNLILGHVPGAQLLQYHGHLRDLPKQYLHLPVIGFVRNPWDWYVSMFFDYRRKPQFVFRILSEGGSLGFEATVTRFLKLGDGSALSERLMGQLVKTAPTVFNEQTPQRLRNPGLRSEHFANFPEDRGYYSWLLQLMFESENPDRIYFGQFENLRAEMLRLFEETGTPVTRGVAAYLTEAGALNSSPRPKSYSGGYTPKLEQLVADKEKYLIDRFGYSFVDDYGKCG